MTVDMENNINRRPEKGYAIPSEWQEHSSSAAGRWTMVPQRAQRVVSVSISWTGEPVGRYVRVDDTITAGHAIDPAALGEEADTEDDETAALVAEAEEDLRAGRGIDGEDLRRPE
jgi:hypothetical protein